MLQEYEENNRHGFDNRRGDKNVTGVYRFVDIVYMNRLINYGKRLMFEFMVPEPAYFYKQALEKRVKESGSVGSAGTVVLEEPISPDDNNIPDAESITEDTYLNFARLYGITIAAPLPQRGPATDSFSPVVAPDQKPMSYDFNPPLILPPDYVAYSADVDFTVNYKYSTAEFNTEFIITIGDKTYTTNFSALGKASGIRTFGDDFSRTFSITWSNELPVHVTCKNVDSFSINVSANLSVSDSAMSAWQNQAYDQIVRAYQALLATYKDAVAQAAEDAKAAEEDASQQTAHKAFNRNVEQREIKRLCIEMLTRPFGLRVGKSFYIDGRCVPEIDQTATLEEYAARVKFFEQAFEWEIISYLFYPYYWAAICDWTKLIQLEYAADPIFEAFLQSGMARVVVPVRRGFEKAVTYYMETGDVWLGEEMVMDSDDDLYLSIAEELQEIEGFVEDEWATRVPTTLTIIQGESVLLEEGGLPCCKDVENEKNTTHLVASAAILEGVNTTIEPSK